MGDETNRGGWTPGPWRVSGSEVVIPDGPFRTHAYCGSKANAALVAAAPDLADALEPFAREAERWYGQDPDLPTPHGLFTIGDLKRALDALLKARGQS